MRFRRFATSPVLLCTVITLCPHVAAAQSPAVPGVRTSFERPVAARQVTFERRAPCAGDRANQMLTVEIAVHNHIRRGQQKVGETDTSMIQRVERLITTDEVQNDRTVGAQIRYVVSERVMKADAEDEAVIQDPIAGKAYLCRRDGERLTVTDEAGHLPTLAEFKIVADSMESLGKPNPLAEFLAGRTIGVGETFTLPDEVAQQFALRMGDGIDNDERFDLTLARIEDVDGRQCAEFQTLLEASETGSRQMKMQLEGTMTIELDSCRMVKADLSGPIGLAETAMSMGEPYHITGTGRMSFEIVSSYSDAR
jgi:hypothetical protein